MKSRIYNNFDWTQNATKSYNKVFNKDYKLKKKNCVLLNKIDDITEEKKIIKKLRYIDEFFKESISENEFFNIKNYGIECEGIYCGITQEKINNGNMLLLSYEGKTENKEENEIKFLLVGYNYFISYVKRYFSKGSPPEMTERDMIQSFYLSKRWLNDILKHQSERFEYISQLQTFKKKMDEILSNIDMNLLKNYDFEELPNDKENERNKKDDVDDEYEEPYDNDD